MRYSLRYMTILSFLLFSTYCGTQPSKLSIVGSGSSFSYPMSSKLIKYFNKIYQKNISFTPNNSYQGIQDLIDGKVDFAVSDVYLSDEQMQQHPDFVHIPISVAGVNFAYNIPQDGFSLYDDPVYLTPEIISDIYLGRIKNWNDPRIVNLNKQVSEVPNRVFPNLPITVVKRKGNSSDTYLLTRFLSKSVPSWAGQIGTVSDFQNIRGREEESALDVIKIVLETPGAFAYSTMVYAVQNNIPLIRVRNYFGTYVRGCNFRSTEAMTAVNIPEDNRVDLTFPTEGKESAVAAGINYIIVRKDLSNSKSKAEAQELVTFINWLLTAESQKQLESIMFAYLTPSYRNSAMKALSSLTYKGEPIKPLILKKK